MLRKIIILTSLILALSSAAFSQKVLSAETILQKYLNKINHLKTLQYKSNRELNYPSTSYLQKDEGDAFIDFTEKNNLLQATYQFRGKEALYIYNGSDLFSLNHAKKIIYKEKKIDESSLSGSPFFGFSPISQRTLLPQLIEDHSIVKKLSQTPSAYIIEFALNAQWINKFGKVLPREKNNQPLNYRLVIDKKSFFVTEVLQKLNETDFMKTNFSSFVINPVPPKSQTWNISSYTSEYHPEKPPKKQIAVGEMAPEINLKSFDTQKFHSLSEYKGKVVMLEFWTFYCSYCMAAAPEINKLNNKFKDKNFKLIGINKRDADEKIALFKKKYNTNFEIWTGGETVAEETYGVYGTPIIVLLNKDGQVIFSNAFLDNQAKIEELINQNL